MPKLDLLCATIWGSGVVPRGFSGISGGSGGVLGVFQVLQTPVDKRFSWSPELVELLIHLRKQYKTKCNFNGHDFEADTQCILKFGAVWGEIFR